MGNREPLVGGVTKHLYYALLAYHRSTMALTENMLRVVFVATLLVLFWFVFGKPATSRFLRQEVAISASIEKTESGNSLPAVTLCARLGKSHSHFGFDY